MNPQPSRAGLRKLALALPDVPLWVETRSLLLSGRCEVSGFDPTNRSNYVVKDRSRRLICVVGKPEPDAMLNAVQASKPTVEVIATPGNHTHTAAVLRDWNGERAWIHEFSTITQYTN